MKIQTITVSSENEQKNRLGLADLINSNPVPDNEKSFHTALFLKRQELSKVLYFQHVYQQFLNTKAHVLFEQEEKSNRMFGFTENYIKVETDYDPLMVNEVCEVSLSHINANGFAEGELNYSTQHILNVS